MFFLDTMGLIKGTDLNKRKGINSVEKVREECARIGLGPMVIRSKIDLKILTL